VRKSAGQCGGIRLAQDRPPLNIEVGVERVWGGHRMSLMQSCRQSDIPLKSSHSHGLCLDEGQCTGKRHGDKVPDLDVASRHALGHGDIFPRDQSIHQNLSPVCGAWSGMTLGSDEAMVQAPMASGAWQIQNKVSEEHCQDERTVRGRVVVIVVARLFRDGRTRDVCTLLGLMVMGRGTSL